MRNWAIRCVWLRGRSGALGPRPPCSPSYTLVSRVLIARGCWPLRAKPLPGIGAGGPNGPKNGCPPAPRPRINDGASRNTIRDAVKILVVAYLKAALGVEQSCDQAESGVTFGPWRILRQVAA